MTSAKTLYTLNINVISEVSNGRFGAMWGGGHLTVDFSISFYIAENLIHRTKYQSFKKIELKENLLCTT